MAKINLNSGRALIFRITHRSNLPWLLSNGLHCKNSPTLDPNYISIGNQDLIGKRTFWAVPCHPGGTLSDYVPFYFTPFSPMMLNIKTGYNGIRQRRNEEIAILVTSLHHLQALTVPFLFTDRHAYLRTARFFTNLADLGQIDWDILGDRDFRRDPDDPEKVERYQAEALVYRHLPINALKGIVCYDATTAAALETHVAKRGLNIKVLTKPAWYF